MENANKMQPAKIDWDKERSEPGWKTNERFVNRGSTGLERCQQLSDIFEKRKTAILNHIRSVHTKNLQSVSMDEINDAMQKYESWTKTQKGMKSNLADFFNRGKPEVFLADGIYRFVKYKEHFFQQLSLQIHKELFEKTEFFKNVAGVLAIRLEPTDGIEDKDRKRQVLLVLNEKTKIWQFPGGKAEYVCHNPNTDKVEIVTQKGDVWQFADGKEAPKDKVTFETPEECLRREISEELDEDVGPATLSSSGFYTIGNSRFLIHGFVAENLLDVDWEKVNRDEIERIDWTSDPFKMEDGSPRPMTDQTKDVLGRFF